MMYDRLLACRGLFWRMVVIARNDRLTACRTCSIDELSRSTLLPRRCRNRGTHTRASCATYARSPSGVSNTLLRSSGATTNHTTPYTSQPFAAYHSLFGNPLDRHSFYETILQWRKFS